MRLVDLTLPWDHSAPAYPGHPSPQIRSMQVLPRDRLESYIVETSMHAGTHLDAPLHMYAGGQDIESIPLDRLYGPAVVIDLSKVCSDWTIVTPQMLEQHAPGGVKEGDIVIVHYGWSRYSPYGAEPNPETYFCRHPGPSPEVGDWLVSRRIRWAGADAPSFEHPMNVFLQKGRPDLVAEFEAATGQSAREVFRPEHWMYVHRVMGKAQIPHVDQLGSGVGEVAGRRVTVGAFPWRFRKGEASICRVVAFVE